MSKRKVSISLYLPFYLWRHLDVKARVLNKSKAELIREALERTLIEADKPKTKALSG
ncbi:MAG TPA: ribbon-helix-helix protein, CopG family [Candidatus Avalokitesvara rifleensis]|uniref:ribbon-helix-helix protein, CopG family n=1 Tax=Candidatus Avalokitesvara rifleensis TaxID=3367620 RepID=UPI004024BE19